MSGRSEGAELHPWILELLVWCSSEKPPQSLQMVCPPPSCDSDGPLVRGLILIIVDHFFQSPEDRPSPDASGQTLKMCSTSTTVLVERAS